MFNSAVAHFPIKLKCLQNLSYDTSLCHLYCVFLCLLLTLFSLGVKPTVNVILIPGATLVPGLAGPTTKKSSDSGCSSFTCRKTLRRNIHFIRLKTNQQEGINSQRCYIHDCCLHISSKPSWPFPTFSQP